MSIFQTVPEEGPAMKFKIIEENSTKFCLIIFSSQHVCRYNIKIKCKSIKRIIVWSIQIFSEKEEKKKTGANKNIETYRVYKRT